MHKFNLLALSFAVMASILLLINNTQPVIAQVDKDTSSKFLFIQSAMSGSLDPDSKNIVGNGNQTLALTLNNVSSQTIAFSDRPQRILKEFDTQAFVDKWNAGNDSFAADPPNAALVIPKTPNNEQNGSGFIVVELLSPVYIQENNTLRYDVKNLDIAGETGEDVVFSEIGNKTITDSNIPDNFGQVTLLIDAGCNPWDPRDC